MIRLLHNSNMTRKWHGCAMAILIALPALAQDLAPEDQSLTITERCEASSNLRTLSAAFQQSGLAQYLDQSGPVTLLAPTDQAFAKLDDEFLDDLFDPNNIQALRAVLAYHLVPGVISADQFASRPSLRTIGTQHLTIEAFPAGVVVDSSGRLIDLDLPASNGVIHTIDTVLLPSTRTIDETLRDDGRFSILRELLDDADLQDELDDPQQRMTLLAPTDDAIEALSPRLANVLDRGSNRAVLRELLHSLMFEEGLSIDDALTRRSVESIRGSEVLFETSGDGFLAGGMRLGDTNIDALNGTIHALETFQLPDDLRRRVRGSLMIGVTTERIDGRSARRLGAMSDRALELRSIVRGGGADRAGLQVGDIVLSVNGYPATSENLGIAKRERGFGGLVELTIVRDGQTMQISVPVGFGN